MIDYLSFVHRTRLYLPSATSNNYENKYRIGFGPRIFHQVKLEIRSTNITITVTIHTRIIKRLKCTKPKEGGGGTTKEYLYQET